MGDNTLEFGSNSYWRKKDDGTYDGPFCMRCADKDNMAIRLKKTDKEGERWECPECENIYYMVTAPNK